MPVNYRFAIVGCGQIGPRHAKHINAAGTLAAVCDTDREKADRLAATYGCLAFYSLDDLLAQPDLFDVVSICTPNFLHASQSIACLDAGFDVVCEKPMCISSADAAAIMEAINRSGRKFFVVKQNRYNPPVALVKKLLNDNSLGKIHSFQVNCFWNRGKEYYRDSWKGRKNLDGGILFTQFSHFVDLLIWYLGEEETAEMLSGNFRLGDSIEFEDTGTALLKMKNGAIGSLNFTITSYAKNMEGSITLFGAKGTVKIGGQYLNTLEYFEVQAQTQPDLPKGAQPNDYGNYQGSMSNHDKVYEQVVLALNNKAHALVEGEEAARTVHLIERLYSSVKN